MCLANKFGGKLAAVWLAGLHQAKASTGLHHIQGTRHMAFACIRHTFQHCLLPAGEA